MEPRKWLQGSGRLGEVLHRAQQLNLHLGHRRGEDSSLR